MFTSIGNAIKSMFTVFTVLFGAAEKFAKSLDNIGGYTEALSEDFAADQLHNRRMAKAKQDAEFKALESKLSKVA